MLALIKTFILAIQHEPPSMWITNGFYKVLELVGLATSANSWYLSKNDTDRIQQYVDSSKFPNIKKPEDLFFNEISKVPNENKNLDFTYLASKKVSILIPFKNEIEILITCLDSIELNTNFKNYELFLINNQSDQKTIDQLTKYIQGKDRISLLHFDRPFNYAAIHNWAVEKIDTDFLLLLNNDTKIITKNWVHKMLSYLNEEVAIVGARLLYPDGTIQHDGVWFGKEHSNNLFINHMNTNQRPIDNQLFMGSEPRYCSAVTAACLLISKQDFVNVGGMDEDHLPIAFNDVDLCFKIHETGKKIVLNPDVVITHYESKSRGTSEVYGNAKREHKEFQYFYKKWKTKLSKGDPYVPSYWTIFKTKMCLRKL